MKKILLFLMIIFSLVIVCPASADMLHDWSKYPREGFEQLNYTNISDDTYNNMWKPVKINGTVMEINDFGDYNTMYAYTTDDHIIHIAYNESFKPHADSDYTFYMMSHSVYKYEDTDVLSFELVYLEES